MTQQLSLTYLVFMEHNDYIVLSPDLQQVISTSQAWHYGIVPHFKSDDSIELYVDDSKNILDLQDELEVLLGKKIKLESKPSDIVQKTLGIYYRKSKTNGNGNGKSLTNYKSDDFLYNLISEANSLGSSDIHIETYEDDCRVRLRIDGKLMERYKLKKEDYPSLVNKIKIKANLDIAEKRLPQDGRIFFTSQHDKFDIRVSILPTLYGEKIVLRLLSKDATAIDINSLGFTKLQLEDYFEGIKKPHGIILISGPTGSGKTTTLYATLKILNKDNTNILTIEDPIEYTLDGINQVQLKESIGLTFASALRTFLRQDPDIIMLGEIRDGETAQMAIRAALTGHLVLSTIHTNSAWGTISRLIDMGVPAFLLSGTLNLTAAQRLVRLLCPVCKKKVQLDPVIYPKSFKPQREITHHYEATGCEVCFYTGYKGRKAVYEIIPIDHDFSEKIKMAELDVKEILQKKGIKQLSESAFELFESGQTSIDEIYPILMNTL